MTLRWMIEHSPFPLAALITTILLSAAQVVLTATAGCTTPSPAMREAICNEMTVEACQRLNRCQGTDVGVCMSMVDSLTSGRCESIPTWAESCLAAMRREECGVDLKPFCE